MKTIYVVGSINTDIVIQTPYIPAKGETLTGSGFFISQGGKGANQAVAAARLGGKVVMCGCVGNDVFGKSAIEMLQSDNIDITNVRIVSDIPTGTAVILLTDGDNRIILEKGANALICAQDVDKALTNATQGDILLIQAEIPIDIINYAIQLAKSKDMFVVLNPAPAIKELLPLVSNCDIVIPNETELKILGGKDNLLKAISGTLIVTTGSKGFEYYCNSDEKEFNCIKVKAVDTTAAGDTFCGGMVVRLACGDDVISSAKFGSAAASLACTRRGAQSSIPVYSEVINFIEETKSND